MPPVPTPKPRVAAPRGGSAARTAGENRPGSQSGSPAAEKPRVSSPPKTAGRPSARSMLKDRLERFYLVTGSIIQPFSRFFPAAEPIGINMRKFSAEAADAWMEVADSDPRMKAIAENITNAGVWGNFIGVHILIVASALPNSPLVSAIRQDGNSDDPIARARAAGLSDEEIAHAMAAAGMQGNIDPSAPIKSDRSPAEAPKVAPVPSGIVPPDALGVQNAGTDHQMGEAPDPDVP